VLSCEAADREAIRYYFNGLPKGRKEAVRAHLAECARCRRKLEAFEEGWLLDGRRRANWT
jgi:anti-sigma factor RsiW